MRGVLLIALAGCSFDAAPTAPVDGSGPRDAPRPSDPDAPRLPPDAAPDAPAPRSCGAAYVAVPAAGTASTYRKVNINTSWPAARDACAADGAYLVIPETGAEARAIGAFVDPSSQSPYYWAGISRVNGVWTTVLGQPFPDPPWAPQQPTNNQGEIYILVGAGSGQFYDFFNNAAQELACECAP